MGRFRSRLYKTDRIRDFDHEQVRPKIEWQGYGDVVLVAGLGFFLDGYTLFASNMTLLMISLISGSTVSVFRVRSFLPKHGSTGASVYEMFFDTSVRGLIALNIGSLTGGLLLILFADNVNRVTLQKVMFLVLAALFITLGSMFTTLTTSPPAVVALYIVGQIVFNFGPNGTTYMIPAEVFPTRYRVTYHGLSAAAGKLGSILVEIFSTYYHFRGGPGSELTRHHGIVLFVFSACMVAGAVITHFWVPSVQQLNGRNRLRAGEPYTLEALALGRMGRRDHEARGANLRKTSSKQRALSFNEYGYGAGH